jgi:hypothetical protein
MRVDLENLTSATSPDDANVGNVGTIGNVGNVGSPAWRRATALVDAARSDPAPLSAEALVRVRRRVERRLRRRVTGARGSGLTFPFRRPLSAGIAALVLLSTVGAAAALWRYRHGARPATEVAPRSSPARPKAAFRTHRGVARATAAGDVAEPVVTAEAIPEPTESPEPAAVTPIPTLSPGSASDREVGHRSRRSLGLPAPAPVPPETEARLLALALGQIRQQHDPAAALATLDRLERRFPGGVLADEARATRIEAAVAAKDLRTATRLVERAAIPAGRSGVAILVMRGELRAQAGRCGDAVADFTQVLAQGNLAADGLADRAL